MMRPGKKKKRSEILLAGDVGGTKTRLGLFQVTANGCRLLFKKTYASKNYSGLEAILSHFIGKEKTIKSACFGVAGPVIQGRVKTTNLPWVVETKTLRNALGSEKVAVVNDLVANAYGLPILKEKDFVILNRGRERRGNAALISAGTGLGEAILFFDGKRYLPSPSEGGHVEFGPRSLLEIELLQYLLKDFSHVSYERILSGDGLYRIYRFLRDSYKFGREPAWLARKLETEDPASVISRAAHSRRQSLCIAALNLFSSIFGAEAGNLALKALAIGGIYVGGGIAPKILWKLREGRFMDAFQDKGRLSRLMGEIPVKMIINENAALLGAASCAKDLLGMG